MIYKSNLPDVTTVQFKCCGTTNFTDWEVADLSPLDDDGVLSNSSSVRSSGGVHGNGSWSLSVPDSCCMDILEDFGCGWDVMNKAESRLNRIHTEARVLCVQLVLTCFYRTSLCKARFTQNYWFTAK